MSVKVILQDDADLDHALHIFNKKVHRLQSIRWYKKRYGYYEKPSLLKRKRKKMRLNLSYRHARHTLYNSYLDNPQSTLWLKIDLKRQFARTGDNAMGR